MLCSDTERSKIISDIHTVSNKVAQEQYVERLKQIVIDIKEKTGQDISSLLPKKKK